MRLHPNADHVNNSSVPVVIFAAIFVIVGLGVITLPLEPLLNSILVDDAFYYFKTAQNFAKTGYSSFDGLHYTNGYQPLWFLVVAPVYKLFPAGGELPLRLILGMSVGLGALSTAVLTSLLSEQFGTRKAVFLSSAWVIFSQFIILNGLESALLLLIYVLLLREFMRLNRDASRFAYLKVGVLSGLVFLARTDSVFLVAALSAYVFLKEWASSTSLHSKETIVRLMCFFVPVVVLAGAYLATNFLSTGHLTPVSGAVKIHYSALERQHTIESLGSELNALLLHLRWPLVGIYKFILMGVIGPWIMMLIHARSQKHAEQTPILNHLWPFYAGALGSFLFYSIVFYTPYTQTQWYYLPHVTLACFVLGFASDHLKRFVPFDSFPELGLLFLIGVVLNALVGSWWLALSGVAVNVLSIILANRNQQWQKSSVKWLIVFLPLIVVTVIAGLQRIITVGLFWLLAMSITMLLDHSPRFRNMPLTQWNLSAIVVTALIQGYLLWQVVISPSSYWNLNLYRGAQWARENLPEDATIWSYSAGILGYFSDRTVVNVDGLINDHQFYDSVLTGTPADMLAYQQRWDYGIDTFSVNGFEMATGCLVPLPDDVQRFPFQADDNTLVITVYQMTDQGIVECP